MAPKTRIAFIRSTTEKVKFKVLSDKQRKLFLIGILLEQ
jgi:hypothetical protein